MRCIQCCLVYTFPTIILVLLSYWTHFENSSIPVDRLIYWLIDWHVTSLRYCTVIGWLVTSWWLTGSWSVSWNCSIIICWCWIWRMFTVFTNWFAFIHLLKDQIRAWLTLIDITMCTSQYVWWYCFNIFQPATGFVLKLFTRSFHQGRF